MLGVPHEVAASACVRQLDRQGDARCRTCVLLSPAACTFAPTLTHARPALQPYECPTPQPPISWVGGLRWKPYAGKPSWWVAVLFAVGSVLFLITGIARETRAVSDYDSPPGIGSLTAGLAVWPELVACYFLFFPAAILQVQIGRARRGGPDGSSSGQWGLKCGMRESRRGGPACWLCGSVRRAKDRRRCTGGPQAQPRGISDGSRLPVASAVPWPHPNPTSTHPPNPNSNPTRPPTSHTQVVEATNMDLDCRLKAWKKGGQQGLAPGPRLLPTRYHLRTTSYWAAAVQVVGMLVGGVHRLWRRGTLCWGVGGEPLGAWSLCVPPPPLAHVASRRCARCGCAKRAMPAGANGAARPCSCTHGQPLELALCLRQGSERSVPPVPRLQCFNTSITVDLVGVAQGVDADVAKWAGLFTFMIGGACFAGKPRWPYITADASPWPTCLLCPPA